MNYIGPRIRLEECGIFGVISDKAVRPRKFDLKKLVNSSTRRGSDSSGIIFGDSNSISIYRTDDKLVNLLDKIHKPLTSNFIAGFSRMKTNSESENQPAIFDDVIVLHNGIVLNSDELWKQIKIEKSSNLDSTVIAAIFSKFIKENNRLEEIADHALRAIQGQAACAVLIPKLGKLVLFSNNGSLYLAKRGEYKYFASEQFTLKKIGCVAIENVRKPIVVDIPQTVSIEIRDLGETNFEPKERLLFNFVTDTTQERLLLFEMPSLRRCNKCILPSTMPFISFDVNGICNYCTFYKSKFQRVMSEGNGVIRRIEDFSETSQNSILVPFSGGRDSTFTLHKLVAETKLKVVAFTYDWGFVTDVARRNISKTVSKLEVEHILVSADIKKKRANVRANLLAWLKNPDLGLLSLLTAGDKFFFKYANVIYREIDARGQCWGINPLEETHFKSGFLGIKPSFESTQVYKSGVSTQFEYHAKRFLRMAKNSAYFNRSIFDTLGGEWYRSFATKPNYIHFFDHYRWEEEEVEATLIELDWERAIDSRSSWRIGDATAPFYNYVYYTVAGFSEHDTFRSNQIREGMISREKALALVEEENQPRFLNIKWYLDALGIDFKETIDRVNLMPKLY